ncbi:MAG: glutathione S-transferase family protein [Archangiaceae bacterium]|nr:glutathione S-transferase family protein [Archangiaceae bacterium]
MLTLHIGNKNYSSWSLRPWVLMKALGVPFTEELHRFDAASAGGGFKAFSPSGRVPCLVDDGGVVVWDSLAIVEYLAEDHERVWPREGSIRAWARSACAEMHAGFGALRNQHSMNVGVRVQVERRSPELLADLARLEQLWSEGLSRFGGPWLCGEAFCAADAFFAPVAFRIQTYGVSLAGAAADYWPRLLALPAMKEWETAALAETFRDAAHDAELARAGRVVKDLRAK